MSFRFGARNAVSLGPFAASTLQQSNAIAIGAHAGRHNQGAHSIAIGANAGHSNQHQSTIVMNATGIAINTLQDNSSYMAPVRFATAANLMTYNSTTKEVTYSDHLSGSLGIGTTTVSAKLHTYGDAIIADSALYKQATATVMKSNGSASLAIVAGGESYSAILYLGTPHAPNLTDGSNSAYKVAILANGNGSGTGWSTADLHFCLNDATGSGTNSYTQTASISHSKMVIKTNGRVGIGLTNPDYKLHVSGDSFSSGNVIGSSHIVASSVVTYNNTADKGKWFKIATLPSKGVATFGVSWSVLGEHGYILLSCGQQYNSTPFIRIIEGNYYGHHIPQRFRLATDNASIYNDAYLEMYLVDTTWWSTDIQITVWIVNKPPINSSVTLFSAKTAATTTGFTYYQVYGYHPIDTNWNGARFCLANTGRVGIGTNDPGQSLDVVGTCQASTQVITPSVSFSGTSNVSIYNGNIDTYNPTGENNLMIYSWWGIGFKSYDGVVRIGIDTRTGDAYFGRNITAKNNLYITNGGGGVNISNGNNGSQILMGWHGSSHQYRHSIQTRHNSGSADNTNAIDFYIWTNAVGLDAVGTRHGLTIGGTGVGIGTTDPSSKLYVKDGRLEVQTGAGRFNGLLDWSDASGRAQIVLSSSYSDLVIASSQYNDYHGSTLTFVSYNPTNYNDYRKWVINQGNWGARAHMLDFGYNANNIPNPHNAINSSDTVLTLDGANKRVGIGSVNPSTKLDVVGDTRVTGMLNIGNVSTNYNSAWSPSILLNCLDQAEITVHDAGSRVVSAMHYNGGNRIYIGRDVGWGSTPVECPHSLLGNEMYTSNWFRVNGSGGLHWESSGAGIQGNSYGLFTYNKHKIGINTSSPYAPLSIGTGIDRNRQRPYDVPVTMTIYQYMAAGWGDQWAFGAGRETNSNLYFFGNTDWGFDVCAYIENDWAGAAKANFTGQHRCAYDDTIDYKNHEGLIVRATGTYLSIGMDLNNTSQIDLITINEALPEITLANETNCTAVLGVISYTFDPNDTIQVGSGRFISVYAPVKGDKKRVYVNSLGEGGIWVCNSNGSLINGDLITSSSIPGYGMKQDSSQFMNYTVGKITTSCDFTEKQLPVRKIKTKKKLIEKPIIIDKIQESSSTEVVYDEIIKRYVQKKVVTQTTIKAQKEQEVDLYDENGEIIGKHSIKCTTIEEGDVDDLDENGNIQWINALDEAGNIIMKPAFKIRYLMPNGNIITKEEYDNIIQSGQLAYIAAFVGCTYHCG